MSTYMETYGGRLVDLASPDPGQISIDDIAWHLSKIPRFNGATRHELAYSTAQHSVLVLNRLRQMMPNPSLNLCLCALLHDAHEAYMGDIISPMKQLLDLRFPLSRLKQRLQRAIYIGLFGEAYEQMEELSEHPKIHEADLWARSYEAHHLMHSKGRDYNGRVLLEDHDILRTMLVWESMKAYESFLNHYNSLKL